MPNPLPSIFKDYKLFEVEIKYGLLQVGEGFCFLHTDVKLLHHNLCPENIIVNLQGAWKIFGFDFCVLNDVRNDGSTNWPLTEYSTFVPHVAQPSLDYLAPEFHLGNTQSPASDMFSLGMLIYAIHNNGSTLYNCNDDWSTHKRKINELKSLHSTKLHSIPQGLREYEAMMLNMNPELRPDVHQFIKLDYFEDVGVKTLNYLDSLFQWDKLQKSQFYKGLPPVIQNLPHRVCVHRVVPCLAKEFANATMVPFVLPSVLQIAEKCTKEEYMQHIFVHLRTVMKLTEPVQILLVFMQKMELLLKLTYTDEVKTDVLPMLFHALECDAQQVQELCLSVLPNYAALIDYPSMKNALLPRIKKLCINTPYISVRVNCLLCIGKLLEHLDKWLVLDEVLPFLPQIPSREPAVLMAILGIYKIALTHKKLGIPKDVIATKIIPFLMPMTIENGLTLKQFNTLFAVIKDMTNRVETEQRIKVEQLNAISQQTNSMNSSFEATFQTNTTSTVSSSNKVDLDSIFSSLEVSSSQANNASSVASNNTGGLTLEDKQRLVKQQEAQQRLTQQIPLITPAPAPSKPVVKPKDLTDTLLQSNLNQMTNWTPKPQVYQPLPNSTPQWPQQNQYTGFSQPMMGSSFTSPTMTFPSQGFANNQNFQSSSQPLLQNKQSTKPLSNSEINDLLG